MSLVPSIRDYVEFLNNSYDSLSGNITFQVIFQQSFLYLFKSLQYIFIYILTFQWLRDFTYLPLLIPQITLSVLKENYYPLENPLLNFLTFTETATYVNNKFIIGFFNSFFICLPISCAHFISARRLLIQGVPAGIAASLGTILGQSWFLICIIFGLRSFVIPWLALEPFNYIFGIFFLLNIIYAMAHERVIKVIEFSEKKKLIRCFLINFFLIWCEQSAIFQYFGGLTLDANPTYVEPFSFVNGTTMHIYYVLGFFLGSCFFNSFFSFLALFLRQIWLKWSTMTTSRLINKLNFFFLTMTLAFSLTSIPYYGLDFLLSNPLGFVPQDKSLQETVFYPNTMKDKSQYLGMYSNFNTFDTDVTSFDDGRYLKQLFPQSFEDLNYQGEYAWTSKLDKKVSTARYGKSFSTWSRLFGNNASKDDSIESVENKNSQQKFLENNNLLSKKNKQSILNSEILENQDILNSTNSNIENNDEPLGYDEPSSYAVRLNEEKKLQKEFFKQIDSGFSLFFIKDEPQMSSLEKKMKKKFYDNQIYRVLLDKDIDFFLGRQPNSHSLSADEETQLFRKRQILGRYYDSLREYNQLQNEKQFQDVYSGSKSYANRVYNHQFKGTLKVVRRLFSITLDPEENPLKKRVLKFDQPLFKTNDTKISPFFHEELEGQNRRKSPFLEVTNPKPFYAGWDEQLRKLVITNRFLPRSIATFTVTPPVEDSKNDSILHKNQPNDYKILNNIFTPLLKESTQQKKEIKGHFNNTTKRINFTAWPISKKILENSTSNMAFSSVKDTRNEQMRQRLNQFAHFDGEFKDWEMQSWPENLRPGFVPRDIIPPTRGGFIWPGSSSLKFDINKFLPNIEKIIKRS